MGKGTNSCLFEDILTESTWETWEDTHAATKTGVITIIQCYTAMNPAQSIGFIMEETDKSTDPNFKKMTDADLKDVLKTVNKSITESMSRAEQAHKERLSRIKIRYA